MFFKTLAIFKKTWYKFEVLDTEFVRDEFL